MESSMGKQGPYNTLSERGVRLNLYLEVSVAILAFVGWIPREMADLMDAKSPKRVRLLMGIVVRLVRVCSI